MRLAEWLDRKLAPLAVSPDQLETHRPYDQEYAKEVADNWKKDLDDKLHKHRFNLLKEVKRHTSYDPYGNEDSTWLDFEGLGYSASEITQAMMGYEESVCQSGLGYFWRYVILDNEDDPREYLRGWKAFKKVYSPKCEHTGETYDRPSGWILYLAHRVTGLVFDLESESLVDVESMSGEEYEEFCKNVLEQYGWQVTVTPKSGDQGVDLIAIAGEMSICIQCKRYSQPVGNSAVQQAFSGKKHYGGTYAAVVTNAGFTQSARQLAESTEVLLLSTEQFISLISGNDEEV